MKIQLCALTTFALVLPYSSSWCPSYRNGSSLISVSTALQSHFCSKKQQTMNMNEDLSLKRRTFLASLVAATTVIALPDRDAVADDSQVLALNLKEFSDPQGLFSLKVPKDFFTLRRSAKGDLPDEKTGTGRRGSSIFSAGNMAKAEIVAVERYPVRVLLEENGIQATGKLQTFPDIGEAAAVANLITLRRDKDKPGLSNTQIIPDSLFISEDQKELRFKLRTEIEVQKPELLMETYGVSQLFRITTAKASLRSDDGMLMAIFASALEKDFMGPDGVALQETVNSFQVGLGET